ncbi:MAG: BrnT family toxin [Bacteriovoracaceae bacterium]|nr:BrnT family toxin [Bacteriovoracaceae bacterium]
MKVEFGQFIWDYEKEQINITKHGIDFFYACKVFKDHCRLVLRDEKHSAGEDRYFCIGKVEETVTTVRFTIRGNQIRIIGAGFWRLGKKIYEEKS